MIDPQTQTVIVIFTAIASALLRRIILREKPPPAPLPEIEFGIFQPVFFQDREYLRLLQLASEEDASCAVELVRECCQSAESPHLDIQMLFKHPDWRPHLVGAVALIIAGFDGKSVEAGWRRIDAGSWVTPQLAAALSMVDPNFVREAVDRLEHLCPIDPDDLRGANQVERHFAMGPAGARQRSAKTAAALLRLLELKDPSVVNGFYENRDLQLLLSADKDPSGLIAEDWLKRIQLLVE